MHNQEEYVLAEQARSASDSHMRYVELLLEQESLKDMEMKGPAGMAVLDSATAREIMAKVRDPGYHLTLLKKILASERKLGIDVRWGPTKPEFQVRSGCCFFNFHA